jgi:YegS/Rv2252/BmrU family lipid kinase
VKDILFIINPILPLKSRKTIESLIINGLTGSGLNFDVIFSNHHRHAIQITRDNLNNYSVFCAVGGDGTVSQVSSVLIHTDKTLGIIPCGSGNGLANFLKLPRNIHDSLNRIKQQNTITIDTCSVNNKHFINLAGIGFDAHVAYQFAKSKRRGFINYIKETVKALFTYKPREYEIFLDDTRKHVKAFLICLCNSNQFGNNAIICPSAKIDDSLITVAILKPFPFYCFPLMVYRLFKGNINKSDYMEFTECRKVLIKNEDQTCIHIDGEPEIIEGNMEVHIAPKSIKVIV